MFDLFPIEGALREATDRLYRVFAKYPKPPVEECVDTLGAPIPAAAAAAWAKPLRVYTAEEVVDFAHHSLCVFFEGEDAHEQRAACFKFWLPRLLEGIARNESGLTFDDWYIADNLNDSRWQTWPAAELEAIRNWASAWIDARLSGQPATGWKVARWAETPTNFAVAIGFDPTPNLNAAMENPAPPTARMIAMIVKSYVEASLPYEQLADSSARGVLSKRQMLRWLLTPSTAERLEQLFFKFAEPDGETAAEISSALEWLTNLREAYQNLRCWAGAAEMPDATRILGDQRHQDHG